MRARAVRLDTGSTGTESLYSALSTVQFGNVHTVLQCQIGTVSSAWPRLSSVSVLLLLDLSFRLTIVPKLRMAACTDHTDHTPLYSACCALITDLTIHHTPYTTPHNTHTSLIIVSTTSSPPNTPSSLCSPLTPPLWFYRPTTRISAVSIRNDTTRPRTAFIRVYPFGSHLSSPSILPSCRRPWVMRELLLQLPSRTGLATVTVRPPPFPGRVHPRAC